MGHGRRAISYCRPYIIADYSVQAYSYTATRTNYNFSGFFGRGNVLVRSHFKHKKKEKRFSVFPGANVPDVLTHANRSFPIAVS